VVAVALNNFELYLDELAAVAREPVAYREVGAYPAVHQDLAFVVDLGVPVAEIFAVAREAAGPELDEVRFLSDYREPPIPAGKKSIAFSLTFRSTERTLTDEDAAELRNRIVSAVERAFGAHLRG